MGKALESFANSVAGASGTGLAGAIVGPIGQQLGYGLGKLTGYNKSLENDQLRQQQALTDIQYGANYGLMKESYSQQKALWESTNAPAEVEQLKKAGLNPALMYKGAGMGSTGGGGASVGGGQASDTASRMNAQNMQTGMGMSLMKLQSEIDLNKATAEKLRADAVKTSGVDTQKGITEIDSMKLQQEYQKVANRIQSSTEETVIETMKEGLKNLVENTNKLISETSKNESEIKTIEAMRDGQVSEIIARAALHRAGIREADQHVELMKKQINELIHSMVGTEIKQWQEDRKLDLIEKEVENKINTLDWNKTAFKVEQTTGMLKSIAQGVGTFLLFKGMTTPKIVTTKKVPFGTETTTAPGKGFNDW